MEFCFDVIIKLLLSVLLGALIGFEREHKNRPAGLRTNILVCLGSTLVQIISTDIFNQYKGFTNIDPGRLGAQVISGIGFLGAGTIIREGASVKGLTTAAGLWVVACIGLAIGNGSYIPAIITAVLAYVTLRLLKGIEEMLAKKSAYLNIELEIANIPGEIGRIGQLLGSMSVNITNIEFRSDEGDRLVVFLSLKIPTKVKRQDIINRLMMEQGVFSIEEI